MNILPDAAYWVALAHLPGWRTDRINNLVLDILGKQKDSFAEFFAADSVEWTIKYSLTDLEAEALLQAKAELPNNTFLVESLYNQGFEIIPFNSPDYSQVLKDNLKLSTPTILYIKGNKQILNESSVAIVGSREASEKSLQFTVNLAQRFSKDYKVVVSGFAKGVDRTALEASVNQHGHSIIVLPQGILTFTAGMKQHYSHIIEGNLLVLSTFPPSAPWSVGLAMARNKYIYGLAGDIYVAQAGSAGGTWAGAIEGLRRGQKVFVRMPGEKEDCANCLLIQKGAVPVDFDGSPIMQDSLRQVKETADADDAAGKVAADLKDAAGVQRTLFD